MPCSRGAPWVCTVVVYILNRPYSNTNQLLSLTVAPREPTPEPVPEPDECLYLNDMREYDYAADNHSCHSPSNINNRYGFIFSLLLLLTSVCVQTAEEEEVEEEGQKTGESPAFHLLSECSRLFFLFESIKDSFSSNCPPISLPTYLPSLFPSYLPTCLPYPSDYLNSFFPTNQPTFPPSYSLPTFLIFFTFPSSLSTYLHAFLSSFLPTYTPSYQPAFLPSYLLSYPPIKRLYFHLCHPYLPAPSFLPTYLPAFPTFLPTHSSTDLPCHTPTYLPTHLQHLFGLLQNQRRKLQRKQWCLPFLLLEESLLQLPQSLPPPQTPKRESREATRTHCFRVRRCPLGLKPPQRTEFYAHAVVVFYL